MRRLIILYSLSLFAYVSPCAAQESKTKVLTDSITKQKKEHSGSVDVVTEARMNKGLVTNSLTALSGQAPGVNVTSGENRMAQLNAVRVRGTTSLTGGNDPLIIIDGIYSDLSTLSSIYPADIESFTILKNASETAQYGSRGASGVIQVTTKKGTGNQFHISYDGNIGFESKYKIIPMLTAPQYIATAEALHQNFVNGGYDTNFQDVITRTGFVTNHHIAFSGGNAQSNYRASLSAMKHNTILRVNGYQNYTTKIDLFQKAFDNALHINFGVFGSSQKNIFPYDEQKLFYSAATQNPTYQAGRNKDGEWSRNSAASQINPPLALLGEKNDEKYLNFNSHILLDFDLLKIFKQEMSGTKDQTFRLKMFGAYSYLSAENAKFWPTWVWAQGQAFRGERKNEDWLGNIMLTYKKKWMKHELSGTLLGEYQKNYQTSFWTQVKGFTTNDFGYDNIAAGSTLPYGETGSDVAEPSMASVMGQLGYTLFNRYVLNASLRADGNSRFGDGNKWGLFPSVSATWRLSDEPFFKKWEKWFNLAQFRIGYGLSGNMAGIASYHSLPLLRPTGTVSVNGTPTTTLGLFRNTNPNLTWETKSTFNIGTNMAFWQNRIVLTAEYYYARTYNMLYQYDVPVPPFTFDKLLANIGSMSNQGVEIGLGLTPIRKKDIECNINLNLSWQKNKLLSLSGDYNGTHLSAAEITPIGGLNGAGFHGGYNNIVYQIVGQPIGVFYLPHSTGLVMNSKGTYSYGIEDLDHNNRINIEDGGDRYIAGQAMPKWTLGSNISLRYKAIDISIQMNGAFGHKIYNGTSLSYMNISSFPDYNIMQDAPKANISDQTVTDYWLERGDYLNFDYVTIGWNIRPKSKYVNRLRLSASVNNLATITAYSGLTPMINSYIVNNTLGIDDKRSYPVYRSYTLGVSIQF